MTDLEKLAAEAMAELVDAKCVDCEDGEAGLLGTSIPVLSKYLEKAHAAGRIEGLEEAAAIADTEIKTVYEEPMAYSFRRGRIAAAQAIRARIQELEAK